LFDGPRAFETRSLSRPVATTAWPAARAALAKSTPIPRLAPVMNQIFLLLMTLLVLLFDCKAMRRPGPRSCGVLVVLSVRLLGESESEHESQAVFHVLQESSRQRARFLEEPPERGPRELIAAGAREGRA
jgi:hypothetical protein